MIPETSLRGERVVVAHNFYRSKIPSGENDAVEREVALLRSAGAEVETFFRFSDDIKAGAAGAVAAGAASVLAPRALKGLHEILRAHRATILHLHNPFPLISPGAVAVAHRLDIPVVQTSHNFRHVCVAGTIFRNGELCTECVGKSVAWPAIRHGCYQQSRTRTIPMVVSASVHRKTFRKVDHYFALNCDIAAMLERAGVPNSNISLKPNVAPWPVVRQSLGEGFLFVGRLAEEKGVARMLEAWQKVKGLTGATLTVVGDGPLRPLVKEAAAAGDIIYRGRLTRDEVLKAIDGARVIVVPSIWPEGAPTVVIEAFARSRPVIATRLGGLAESVDAEVGWVTDGTAADLASAFVTASREIDDAAARGRRAADRAELRWSAGAVVRALREGYSAARARSRIPSR